MATNMNINENKNATTPVMDFSLPKSEVDIDVAVGEFGEVCIPVEVVEVGKDTITFRKRGKAEAEGSFHQEPLEVMKERIGEVEDEEEDFKKDSKENE
jgi:hypothetical protein